MAYQYPLSGGRINATIGGNTAGVGSLVSTGTMTLVGGNNIVLSQNGNAITISGSNAPAASINFSAGTTSNNLGAVTFANSNGVSFGLNGSTITGSHNGLTSQSNQAFSAGGGSSAFQTLSFGNSNGVTFSNSNGSVVGSVQTNYAATNVTTNNMQTTERNNYFYTSNNTFANQTHTHGNPTLALTNLSGTTGSASNGLTISLSAAAPGGGAGSYNILAAGTQTANTTGTVNFANSNGISFGMSGSSQITASYTVPTQTAYSFSNANGVSFGTNGSTVTGSVATNYAASNHSHGNPTLNLTNLSGTTGSASNGLTLSLSAPAMFDAGVSNAAGGSTFGTMGTANTGGMAFFAGDNIGLSQSTAANGNASVTIQAAAGGGSVNFSAGTTSADLDALTFEDANGVSFGINGSTLTASVNAAGGGVTYSYFNPQDAYLQVTGQHGQATLHMQPSKVPNVAFDRIVMPVYYSNASNSTASITASFWFGVYTRTSASFSLSTSASTAYNWIGSGTVNAASYHGIRLLSIGMTDTILEDQYYFGIVSRTTTAGNNATFQQLVASQMNSTFSGIFGQSSNASVQYTRGLGYYSATTSGMPSVVAMSQLRGNSSMALRQPLFYFVNNTF